MVLDGAANNATNFFWNSSTNLYSRSKVSSKYHKSYAIKSPPNSFRDKHKSNASQPSQQPPPPSTTSQIQPPVTLDHQGKKPDSFSSSQTQPSKNNGTKTSTTNSDPLASSRKLPPLISFGTLPPLPAGTAKTSSPATLSTTSTSRPSPLPGDTANGDHEWKKCRSCHNHVKDCCWQSVLAALSHSGNIAALGHKSTNVIQNGSQ